MFGEPWQAEAFGLVIRLFEAGYFTWPEWAESLAAAIRESTAAEDGDNETAYYLAWLSALERLALARQLVDASGLECRKAAWTKAYQSTPHGQPVLLPSQDAL